MIRSILVPLDGSQFGEHALPLAVSIANRAGAKLQVTYVHPPFADVHPELAPYVVDDTLTGAIKTRHRAYLDEVVDRIKKAASIEASCLLKEGPIAPTIREEAESGEFELVVMTTHGRGPFGRFWLGSVADELLRDLSVPLLLVRPTDAKPDLDQEAGWKRLLIPLDGSAFSEAILEYAADLSSSMKLDIHLLRAVQPVMLGYYGPGASAVGPAAEQMINELQRVEKRGVQEAEQYLEGVAERLRKQSLKVETQVVVEDQPAAAILKQASNSKTDVLAIETHGRHGLARFLWGSIADKVIRGASVPVLVHRHKQ